MRPPVVGITTYGPEGKLESVSLPGAYLRAVAGAGGLPVLIGPSGADAGALLDAVDALILSGGGDLDPASHGGGTHASLYGVVPERDGALMPTWPW